VKGNKYGYKIFQPLLLGVAMAIGMLLGVKLQDKQHENVWIQKVDDQIAPIGRAEELLRFIESKYVDSLEQDILVQQAVSSIVGHLDEYSEYIVKGKGHSLNESLDQERQGIGIKEVWYDGNLYIYDVLEKSTAESVGLKKGDKIVSFNDVALDSINGIENQNYWFANASIGEACKIGVTRNYDEKVLTFEPFVSYYRHEEKAIGYRLNDSTAYIKIKQFSKGAYKRFMSQLEFLYDERKPIDHLIIDVRDNSGGYLEEVINIANQFFEESEQLLLTTYGKTKKETVYRSTGRSFFPIKKLVILINHASASASEILAGIIQDYELGQVVGSSSFGKGMVQEQFVLENGDLLRLSTARYKLPSGREVFRDSVKINRHISEVFYSKPNKGILKSGKIEPDMFIEFKNSYNHEFLDQLKGVLEPIIFSKIYNDRFFYDSFIKDNIDLTWNQTQKNDLLNDLKTEFDIDNLSQTEKDLFLKLVRSILINHTKNELSSQAYWNESDPYILKALNSFLTQ